MQTFESVLKLSWDSIVHLQLTIECIKLKRNTPWNVFKIIRKGVCRECGVWHFSQWNMKGISQYCHQHHTPTLTIFISQCYIISTFRNLNPYPWSSYLAALPHGKNTFWEKCICSLGSTIVSEEFYTLVHLAQGPLQPGHWIWGVPKSQLVSVVSVLSSWSVWRQGAFSFHT